MTVGTDPALSGAAPHGAGRSRRDAEDMPTYWLAWLAPPGRAGGQNSVFTTKTVKTGGHEGAGLRRSEKHREGGPWFRGEPLLFWFFSALVLWFLGLGFGLDTGV